MGEEPNIVEALDRNRFRDLQVKSVLAANLWLAINLAAQRHDAFDVRAKTDLLRTITKATIALVNALGTKDVANG